MLAAMLAIKTAFSTFLAVWLVTAAPTGAGTPPEPAHGEEARATGFPALGPLTALDLAAPCDAAPRPVEDSRDVVERLPDWRLEDGSCPVEDVDETDDGSAEGLDPPSYSPPTRSTGPGCRVVVTSCTPACPRFLLCGRLDC